MQQHLDALDERFDKIVAQLEGYHAENRSRLIALEKHAEKSTDFLKEWTGGDEPELGLRRVIHRLVDERRILGIGWKVIAAFGAAGTAIIAGWTAINAFLQAHK